MCLWEVLKSDSFSANLRLRKNPFAFIVDWQPYLQKGTSVWVTLTEGTTSLLSAIGREQAFSIGQSFFEQYGFTLLDYDHVYTVKYADQYRVEETARWFAYGFWGINASDYVSFKGIPETKGIYAPNVLTETPVHGVFSLSEAVRPSTTMQTISPKKWPVMRFLLNVVGTQIYTPNQICNTIPLLAENSDLISLSGDTNSLMTTSMLSTNFVHMKMLLVSIVNCIFLSIWLIQLPNIYSRGVPSFRVPGWHMVSAIRWSGK